MNGFFLGMIEITAGMSLLILVMLLGLKFIGGKFTAKCRYILWTLVMIRLAVPFSFGILPALIEVPVETEPKPVQVQMQVPTADYTPVPQNPVTMPPQEQVQIPSPPVQTPVFTEPEPEPITWDDVKAYIPHVWLIGAAVFLLWNLLSYGIYTAKILRTANEADAEMQEIYEAVCRKKGLTHPPKLLVSHAVNSPAAFGLIRRRIVLPEIDFTENGLAGTLSHEVTHCKRGDLWIKALCLLARALHWFNPLVHLAAFRCEMEMELSCDESVLMGCDENTRAAYGEVMLDIIKRCRRNRGALTTHFNPGKNAVKARFTNILYGSGKRRGLWLIAVCLVLCLIAGAIVACRTEVPEEETGTKNTETPDESLSENSESGEFPTMEAYVTDRMAQETTAKYFAAEPDGSYSNQQKTANVTDTKLTVLEKKGELAGLAPDGVLECWRYKYLLKLDVPTEEVIPVGGQDREDDWFDLEGQNGHTVVALRHTDGTYTILMDEMTGDGLDFNGYRNSYEEAIYDWYVTEYDLALPLYVEEWGDLIIPPEGERIGNTPVHRFDGDGWGIYIPVQAWYQSKDAMDNQWLWRSSYNTGSTLMVDEFSHSLEDEYVTAEKQGYTPADSTKRVWENHTDGLHSCYYYYENPSGGFWRVTIEWTDEGITDYPYIAIEPQVLRLMAEKFVVFGTGNPADNAVTVTSPIYLCDDVYRGDITPTHGESTITFPDGLDGYKLYTCEVLLCNDGCDMYDVVYRNYFGYAGGFPLQEMKITKNGSYTTGLWLFTYPDEILEQILSDMEKGGASEEEKQVYRNKRVYLYHLTIDKEHCACIFIEPENIAARPENEQEILDALVASVEIDITRTSEENWKQYTESHTVSGQEFNVSFTCPERWQIESSGILNDENGKRIGERVFREGFSFEEFKQESSFSNGHSVLNNSDSPYQGSTDSDMEYIGYHKSVQSSIDYSSAEVYTFLVQYNDSMFMHISVWQHETDAYEDFLNSVVLPIINSVTIEKVGNDNIAPSVSTVDPDTIWQTFLDTVVSPYSEYISSYEFLDLDGNGIDELILYDYGMGVGEIFTIENGEVRSFYTGEHILTHYSDDRKALAPPSLGAGEYVFYASRTPTDESRAWAKNWFVPSPAAGGYVLYSTYGHTTSRTDQYFHFYSGEDAGLGKFLCVEELIRFERDAVNSNPEQGWICYVNGQEVSNTQYIAQTKAAWADILTRYGVEYTDDNTLAELARIDKAPNTIEEIILPESEVPDGIVDEDSEPYTYTREEWIRYSLYTDFGFRKPVDVSALTDDELTAYMADAYQCALDIYFLFHVDSDRMYARNVWSSDMPHVEIDGRYYSRMFNPVFPTLADLESYMNGVLSHDLTRQLLSMGMFIDYEGALWGMMGTRGTDISKKTVGFSVTSRTDTEIIYTAEVEVREHDLGAEKPDYVEYHDFRYTLTDAGWRWTDFYLYN